MKLILSYLKKYRSSVALGVVVKVFSTLFELLIPLLFEYMLDSIVPEKNIYKIILFGFILILLVFLSRETSIRANKRAVGNASRAINDLRRDLFSTTLSLDGEDLNKYGISSLVTRMAGDQYNLQSFMQTSQTLLPRAPVLLLGGFIMTFLLDRSLSLILVILLPLVIGFVIFISKKGIPLYSESQKEGDRLTAKMRENISGVRVIRALSKEEYEKSKFDTINSSFTKKDTIASLVTSLPVPLVTFFMNIGLCFVVLFGAFRVSNGKMEAGVILAFLTYFQMILTGLTGINRIIIISSKASSSSKRVKEVLSEKSKINKENIIDENDDAFIVFDNVSFSYENCNDKYVLKNISFKLNKGESLGIIGPTGSGKSTILNLLLRFYDPDEGNIYIHGKNIKSYDKKELRKMFSVVQQNDSLFEGSIKENISFKRDLSDEEIQEGIKKSEAEDFINSYKEGIEHPIALKGGDLSGGQKGRVLLSRALSSSSDILVLDDVTSALDYETESKVRNNIKELSENLALIIIGERVSSVKFCDKILFLDDGNALYYLPHEEMIRKSNEYRELYEEQMGDLNG